MRGHEDEWMDEPVYVVALGAWLSPTEYLDYIAKTVAEISTDEEAPPWP